MATPRLFLPARSTRQLSRLAAGAALAVVVTLVGAMPSSAAPNASPVTSGDAKKVWEDSSHQAELAAEQLNGAALVQRRATRIANSAAAALTAADLQMSATRARAAQAMATADGYQRELDRFGAASFRGARLSPLSTMLTARSATDFLDQSTVVARIAQQSRRTMSEALAARGTAQAAATAAQVAQRSAVQAKTTADDASTTARTATETAKTRKSQLDVAAAKYKALYGKLTAQERQAAAEAAAKARAESLAAAEAAQEQQRQAAAKQQARQDAAQQQAAAWEEAQQQAAAAQQAKEQATVPPSAAAPTTAAPTTAAPDSALSILTSSMTAQSASPSPPPTPSADKPSSSSAAAGGGDNLGQIVAQAALTKVGGGYCYACDGPTSYDCSGLTTWAWAQAGISIPRVSYEQAKFPVVPMDQLQPGDLVTYYSPVSHVAIYVGNGMIVSAVDEQSGIMYRPVGRGGPNAVGHRVPRG